MDEEITPTEPTETPSLDYPSDDMPPAEGITELITTDVIPDDRTLMGTVLQTVFGNHEIMVFLVTVMVLVTLLLISTDFMRWKGRE